MFRPGRGIIVTPSTMI